MISDRIGIVLDISCRGHPGRQWSFKLYALRKTHRTGFSTICVTCKGISHRASPSQAYWSIALFAQHRIAISRHSSLMYLLTSSITGVYMNNQR